MFGLFGRAPAERFIDDGKVWCPVRRRDVEFDLCVGCPSLEAIALDGDAPYVRCEPDPTFR